MIVLQLLLNKLTFLAVWLIIDHVELAFAYRLSAVRAQETRRMVLGSESAHHVLFNYFIIHQTTAMIGSYNLPELHT
jgi:hypothetical protein